jgi:hypothetical protein
MDNHNYMYLCIYRPIARLVHSNLLIVRLSSSSEHCPMSAELSKSGGELTLIKWMLGLLLGGVLALILKAFFPG